MILLAGGTGTLGGPLRRILSAHGDAVRVLTRAEDNAGALRDAGVDVVVGDVRVPAAAAAAVRSCSTVISAIHGFVGPRGVSPATIDRDGNRHLIRAAADAGVEHFVLVSAYGASATHAMSLHRMKYAAELSLVDSGLTWTVIRPVPFLETWISVIGARLPDRGQALVLGRGENPINMVSVRDVAAAIDRAVRDDTLRNRSLDLAGPDALTMRHIAERLVATAARPGTIRHVPEAALRAMSVLARPFAPAFARQAQAAVVMNTTDMTAPAARAQAGDLGYGAVTLEELLRAR